MKKIFIVFVVSMIAIAITAQPLKQLPGTIILNNPLDFRLAELKKQEPLFKYTYTTPPRTYQDPEIPSIRWKIPKEITQINPVLSKYEKPATTIETSAQQAAALMFTRTFGRNPTTSGIDARNYGAGADSSGTSEIQRILWNFKKGGMVACAHGIYQQRKHEITTISGILGNQRETFRQNLAALDSVPLTAEANAQTGIFIRRYGGMFFGGGKAVFGGSVTTYTFFNAEIMKTRSLKWLLEQTNRMYHFKLWDISPGPYQRRSQINLHPDFLKNTNTELFFTGGVAGAVGDLKKWKESINVNPDGLLSLRGPLDLMAELLSAEELLKKQNLEWSILQYYNHGAASTPPPRSDLIDGIQKVPGYSLVGSGFDITTLTNRALVLDHDHQGNGWTNRRVWANPFYPEIKFQVPFSTGLRLENSNSGNSTMVFENPAALQQSFASKWIYGSAPAYAASRSRVVRRFIKQQPRGRERYFKMSISSGVNWYDLALSPMVWFNPVTRNQLTNPEFLKAIEALPSAEAATASGVIEKYLEFIEKFGTHFIMGVKLGGTTEETCLFPAGLLRRYSMEELERFNHVILQGYLSRRGYAPWLDFRIPFDFLEASVISMKFAGGKIFTEIGKSNSGNTESPLEEFQKIMRRDLGPLSYRLNSLDQLFTDFTKRELFQKAVKQYTAAATTRQQNPKGNVNYFIKSL